MKSFAYSRPTRIGDAAEAASAENTLILAGGTTMVDLMKIGVQTPDALVDIGGLSALEGFEVGPDRMRFGALAKMSTVADDQAVIDAFPALSESLWKAASPQLRNVATLGGNILQRTRCPYFRDTAYSQCNKRTPGSGCAALDGGETTLHAIFGGSDACVAMYPGDFAQTLVAFDAEVTVEGPGGTRTIPFNQLHVLPGTDPQTETVLEPGEIVTEISLPVIPAMANSVYLKARERESYAFASASAAVGVEMDGDTVRDVRIGLGGVAAVPWRATAAEDSLKGQPLTEETAREAGRIAFQDAEPLEGSAYKIALGADVVAGALLQVKSRMGGE
ncbi:4-hydroxybenzoyl-CoA reductase subunit beta [Rhodobacteraceae bacterium THAF1]|uniref:FAD binding domain-containing protein n=1 Tax=Palleronia sp. THAF1 TaxID=2587842 RepID=UPI000F40EF39|nr:xanthine dehydrogenase family protein subunit M [Palleronia sp. THAF1]QFU08519.1 4-hydroxybenzoyl-CoA reductase subunit beta [Palleronia sp. THAF1]VDC28614.1 4-hydroxybenzoyl-CoA reductase subunit beta [Rhodobacteraceae bacterium THAF1]